MKRIAIYLAICGFVLTAGLAVGSPRTDQRICADDSSCALAGSFTETEDIAGRYRKIRLADAKKQDSTLFNGEYYIQIPNEIKEESNLTGCHIDQLLGQWWAHQLNLRWLYPPHRIRTALLASQGFVYDGPAGLIEFRPVWRPDDHVSFFTAAEAWGVFTQSRKGNLQTELIEVRYGQVRVASLVFQVSKEAKSVIVTVLHNRRRVPSTYTVNDGEVRIMLREPVLVKAGESWNIEL